MKITKSKLLRTCLNKRRKTEFQTPITSSSSSSSSSSYSSSSSSACESCCKWGFWPSSFIPRDVPRGHLAVYVGKNCRRFVIRIALLGHPLFLALLDRARDEYGFTPSSKLCIPCDESMFIEVVHCAGFQQDRRDFLCF